MSTTKSYPIAEFKAVDGDAPHGSFEALVSVFGNVDIQGDRVVPGAFEKSLEGWRASGDPIPVIWSHDWGNVESHIGFVDPSKAEETPEGLKVAGQLDMDNPRAAQVWKLLLQRRVKEWSFAYDVNRERTASDGANDLLDLTLLEVGPTLKGANDQTTTLGVKSDAKPWHIAEQGGRYCVIKDPDETLKCYDTREEAEDYLAALYAAEPDAASDGKEADPDGAKVGRSISAKNESRIRAVAEGIRAHAAELESVLSAVAEQEEPKAEEQAEAKSEESEGAKDEESPWERHLRLAAEIADLGVR